MSKPCWIELFRFLLIAGTLASVNAAAGEDPPAKPENVLANPGFESGDEGPDGWSFTWKSTRSKDPNAEVKQEPDWGWDSDVRHAGERSVRIGVARPEDDGVWMQSGIPHREGTSIYRLRFWVRAEGLEGASADAGCICLGADGAYLASNYSVVRVTENHDWKESLGFFEVAPGTAALRLRLWLNRGYSGEGTVWFDDLSLEPTDLKELPSGIRYVDDKPLPDFSQKDKECGYAPFVKDPLEMVFPETRPRAAELSDRVELFAAPGEWESATFCLWGLRDVGAVRVECGELRCGDHALSVSVHPVKCLARRGQARWGPFMDGEMRVPVIVEDTDRAEVTAGETKQFHLRVKAPEDAAPGQYEGKAEIVVEGGGRRTVTVSVEVLPIRLVQVEDMAFGMYTRFRREPPDFLDTAYRDMREHGMNTIGLSSSLGAEMRMEGDGVVVALDGSSDLETAMEAYRRAGFTRPLLWLMGSDVVRFCLRQGALESEAFEKSYRAVIESILRVGKERGWPEILFQPIDEPYEHADHRVGGEEGPRVLDAARRCLQILKSIPGVRTEEDGANGRPENAEALHRWVDVEVYHDGPVMRRGTYDADAWAGFLEALKRDGKEVWFYNTDITGFHPEAVRFGYGFGLFRSGAKGALNWSYMTSFKPEKPDGLYQNPLPMANRYNRTETEPGGPTTAWEATREGVDDYRYLRTFFAAAGQARKAGRLEEAKAAEAEVEAWLAKIDFRGATGTACQGDWTGATGILPTGEKYVSGDYKMANGLAFGDYRKFRRCLADWIVKLEKAGGE